jgi:ABC-type Na+ transport system ATPase subunit NatA
MVDAGAAGTSVRMWFADGMALPDRLSGREVLLYLGLLRGMPREVVTAWADELLRVRAGDLRPGPGAGQLTRGVIQYRSADRCLALQVAATLLMQPASGR